MIRIVGTILAAETDIKRLFIFLNKNFLKIGQFNVNII